MAVYLMLGESYSSMEMARTLSSPRNSWEKSRDMRYDYVKGGVAVFFANPEKGVLNVSSTIPQPGFDKRQERIIGGLVNLLEPEKVVDDFGKPVSRFSK